MDPFQAIIIPILILNNKTVMSFSYRNKTLWPVYITIGNLDSKTRCSQKRLRTLLLSSIFLIYKWSEDVNNKNKDLKAKIYHMVLKTMLPHTYPGLFSKEMIC